MAHAVRLTTRLMMFLGSGQTGSPAVFTTRSTPGSGDAAEKDGVWRLYLPAQEAVPGSNWQAGIQVQNSGTATAIIGFNGIAANGTKTDCGQVETPPGGSANFLTLWGCPAGHPVFSAGVASSDQHGAAIASISNAPAGVAGGQYRGMNGADASKSIFFPLVKHNHNKRTTAFSVQNAGDQPSAITAVFKVNGQTTSKTYSWRSHPGFNFGYSRRCRCARRQWAGWQPILDQRPTNGRRFPRIRAQCGSGSKPADCLRLQPWRHRYGTLLPAVPQ